MREILLEEILHLDQRYRANLINSIGGFKSVAMVGTKSRSGHSNLAIFNSFFHLGAQPPLFGFIVRPDSVERHTLENILETNSFTVNHLNEYNYKQAHQTSARYPKETSEFDATGLQEEYINGFHPPFVLGSKIQIGAEFQQKTDVSANGTILIVAKIQLIRIEEEVIGKDGFIDLEKSGTITCSGLDCYHRTQKLSRLSYAKTDRTTTEID